MENKLKYLELIQNIINRMANNSFLIKGWCITLISALLAIGSQSSNSRLISITLLPLTMFWFLDAYFLQKERLFRKLYEKVCNAHQSQSINFSMDTTPFLTKTNSWIKTAFSRTLILFYGTILLAIAIAVFLITR